MNLTTKDLQVILYSLEEYMKGNDDTELVEELDTICNKIDKELEEKCRELDEINELKSLLKEDKVYPQVDNIPEQVYQDWLYNKEANNK